MLVEIKAEVKGEWILDLGETPDVPCPRVPEFGLTWLILELVDITLLQKLDAVGEKKAVFGLSLLLGYLIFFFIII